MVADPDAGFQLDELPPGAPTFFGADVDTTVIPEPGTVGLVVIGVLLLAAGGCKPARWAQCPQPGQAHGGLTASRGYANT